MYQDCTSTNRRRGEEGRISVDGDGAVPLAQTMRTRVRRQPDRGSYDRDVADRILDEAVLCHVGFAGADGGPVVIPTTFARDGDRLLLHGSPASRMLRTLAGGVDVCVTVTLLDGIVFSRSAFHTSMNYRSVVMFGRAIPIADADERRQALQKVVEHVIPGQTAVVRAPTAKEVAGTLVLALPIDEASVKVRTGPPVEEESDLDAPVWGGEVPVALVAGEPVSDDDAHRRGISPPAHATSYARGPRSGVSRSRSS